MTHRDMALRLFLYAALTAVTFLVCFPLIWAFFTSMKPKDEIFLWPPTLWPSTWTLENYRALLVGRDAYSRRAAPRVARRRPRPSSSTGSGTASS